jgi:RNase P subunit RPR2
MNIKLTLTDEELGFLYGMLYRSTQERGYRRHRRSITEAEKLAQKLALSLRSKARKALPRGAARAIEVVNAGLL